jgi:hypothetical protein
MLEEVVEMDQVIAKAKEKLKRLSEDEETLRMYELREKQLSDTLTRVNGTKREIAKNMLKKFPSISVSDVADITGLDIEDVKDLEKDVR